MGKNQSVNDFMEDCRIKIYNASSDEVISARLLPFGYDEAKHTANKTIYTDTVALVKKNENEDAEWRTASELFNKQQKKTRKDFSQIRKKLKFYYPATSAEANTLGLYEDKITKYTDFLQVAKNFYGNLVGMQEVLDKLAPFGYTLESVQALQADVEQLDVLRENREKEGGDAQYATKERNTKMDELYEAANEITRLAKLVFEDDEAQYLEKLGIIVRS